MHLTAPSHWSPSIVTGGRDASERVVTIVVARTIKQEMKMGKHNEYFVVPRKDGKWAVGLPHADRASALEDSQKDAIRFLARHSSEPSQTRPVSNAPDFVGRITMPACHATIPCGSLSLAAVQHRDRRKRELCRVSGPLRA